MIYYAHGNIFESPAGVLVNPCNTVGVMGAGLALQFKIKYPEMFVKYQRHCQEHLLFIRRLALYTCHDGKRVLCFPTKQHWRDNSQIDYISIGLQNFRTTYAKKKITSVAFPKLGCGKGNLSWDDVKPIMEKYLSNLPIDVYIYE